MERSQKLFVNYNFVKGAQEFLKDAGVLKYANEEVEDMDANAVADAMIDQEMDAYTGEKINDNAILEAADALVELAQTQGGEVAEKAEDAAAEVAKSVAPAGEAASESEMEAMMNEAEKEKEAAKKVAATLKKAMSNDTETKPDPAQNLTPTGTDYVVPTGKTKLDTEKGEVGAEENKNEGVTQVEAPDADIKQHVEGEDIHGKDYASPGKGKSNLPTEKGEIGVEEKADAKLARLAMESTLAKILNK